MRSMRSCSVGRGRPTIQAAARRSGVLFFVRLGLFGEFEQVSDLQAQLQRDYGFDQLIGSGAVMRRVFETVQKVAETDLSVLIRGESGTGKELVARLIHQASERWEGPFVAVNCGALPENLIESELFGHEKGSFTGAYDSRKGYFEVANGGTIFLDEIGETSATMQAKLLRVIQEREIQRVGGNDTLKVDVRILAATNKNLKNEVERGVESSLCLILPFR